MSNPPPPPAAEGDRACAPPDPNGFCQDVLDALTAHICVLDDAGKIVAVNRAWREFAATNPPLAANANIGADYFAVCEAASGEDAALAREALQGLRAVARGERPEFSLEYPCHSPDTQRWFELRATRLDGDGPGRLVTVHRNITERKQAEDDLTHSREVLRALTARLEDVREEERIRIARAIHDDLGHALTDLKLDVAWLDRRLAASGLTRRTAARKRLAAMSRNTETAAQTVRRIATPLRPAVLDALGLHAAIEWQAREFQERAQVRCDLQVDPDLPPLTAPQVTTVFRAFQEILNNVSKHAQATCVNIRLSAPPGRVVLQVEDDGRGISIEDTSRPTALGLLGVRERAAALGGGLVIRGSPGRGTAITLSIPIPQA